MSTFDNLVREIGLEASEKLTAAYGGQRIYVPVQDAFVNVIGPVAAMALSRCYGGERVELPTRKKKQSRIREDVLRLHESGYSIGTIVRMVKCTRRYVFRILADQRQLKSSREILHV